MRCSLPTTPSKRASVWASSVGRGAPLATGPPRGRSCFGRRLVLRGQKRVPLPPAMTTSHGSDAGMAPAPVGVLDAHDVVQVIRGDLEDLTVLDGDHPVLPA